MARQIHDAALDLVREQEASGRIVQGKRNARFLTCYLCPAGVPTIGYGHTKTVTMNDVGKKKISVEEAERLLAEDMAEFAEGVSRLLQHGASNQQFGAMVSLAFNIGINGFSGSTVLRLHNLGDFAGAAAAFAMWNKGGGRVLIGLVKRRAAEATLYLEGSGPHGDEMPQAVHASSPVKPITESRSIKAAQISGGLAATIPIASAALDQMDQVKALLGRADGLLPIAPWLAAAVLAAGLAYMVWRRIEDSGKGEQG